MVFGNRLLLRGLQKFIPEGSTVLAVGAGTSDALGTRRKVTAVLTTDALLLATAVRAKTVLTIIPRGDIRSVISPAPDVVSVDFDDYARAMRRVVELDLSRRGDKEGVLQQLIVTDDRRSQP